MKLSTEYNLISSLLRYPDMLVDVLHDVPVQAITVPELQRIYEGIISLWRDGHTVDSVAVYAHLKGTVPASTIAEITDLIPSKASLLHYAGEVKRNFQKRRISDALQEQMDNLAFYSADEVIASVANLVSNELHADKKNPGIASAATRFIELQNKNAVEGLGLGTGFICFDQKNIVYQPKHLHIIGAFTSTGKTSLCIEQIHRVFSEKKDARVEVISTEMSEEQLIARLISRRTKFNTHYLLSGRIKEEHREEVDKALFDLQGKNLRIHDDVYDFAEIQAVVKKAHMQGGVDVVFIDYAQNITVKGARSEYEQSDAIAKGLQRLAKDANCTIVLYSQLSNEAAKDDNGILQYKGGGTLSAVADLGIILKKHKDKKGLVMMEVRKNRHGPLLKQALQFEDGYTRMAEIHHESNE